MDVQRSTGIAPRTARCHATPGPPTGGCADTRPRRRAKLTPPIRRGVSGISTSVPEVVGTSNGVRGASGMPYRSFLHRKDAVVVDEPLFGEDVERPQGVRRGSRSTELDTRSGHRRLRRPRASRARRRSLRNSSGDWRYDELVLVAVATDLVPGPGDFSDDLGKALRDGSQDEERRLHAAAALEELHERVEAGVQPGVARPVRRVELDALVPLFDIDREGVMTRRRVARGPPRNGAGQNSVAETGLRR